MACFRYLWPVPAAPRRRRLPNAIIAMFAGLMAALSVSVMEAEAKRKSNRQRGPIALVHDPALPLHRALVDAYTAQAKLPRTIILSPGESWPLDEAPHRVISIGTQARSYVLRRWPRQERAELLTWTPDPNSALWISASLDTQCVSRALLAMDSEHPWVVIADSHDIRAHELADALHATLVQGGPAQITQALLNVPLRPGTKIWLRPGPETAQPLWLERLGTVGRLPGFSVGSSIAELQHFGFENWVSPDVEQSARDLAKWATRPTKTRRKRRGHTRKQTESYLACRTD